MSEAICVGVRLRPFVGYEAGQAQVLEVKGNTVSVIAEVAGKESKSFTFDAAMDSTQPTSPTFAGQSKCYKLMAQRMVEHVSTGFNTCLFCYGQTGTGKTTTIMGSPEPVSEQGLLLRLIYDLFEKAKIFRAGGSEVHFKVQMLEVYNEKIKDLLGHGANTICDVHVHPTLGVYLKGVIESPVNNFEDCIKLIDYGNTMKTVAATAMNAKSSRGHTVFKLLMEKKGGSDNNVILSEVFFVDLAGRENEKTTKVTGDRFAELSFINRSLMWLANCIQKMADDMKQETRKRKTMMPGAPPSDGGFAGGPRKSMAAPNKGPDMARFRNSKLTLLLANALNGNSKTSMIGTLSPALANFEESFSTLNFAATVKSIKVEAKAAVAVDKDALVKDLQSEVQALMQQLELAKRTQNDDQEKDISRQVEATRSLVKSYSVTFQEAEEEAVVHMEKREEKLARLGIAKLRFRDSIRQQETLPHLANCSDDPYLSGRLLFYPPEADAEHIIGFEEGCDFTVPRSLGLSPQTCQIRRDSVGRFWIRGVEQGGGEMAHVELNRRRIGVEPVELKHHDCVVLGRSQMFFAFTKADGGMKNLPMDKQLFNAAVGVGEDSSDALISAILTEKRLSDPEQLRQAHKYHAQLQSQNLNGEGVALLQDFLLATKCGSNLVEEANEITKSVRPGSDLRFDLASTVPVLGFGYGPSCLPELSVRLVRIISPEQAQRKRAEDTWRRKTVCGVLQKLKQFATDGDAHAVHGTAETVCIWTFQKFTTRLQLMHDVYGEWAADPDNYVLDIRNDPWSEFGPAEINEIRQEDEERVRTSLAEVRMLREDVSEMSDFPRVSWQRSINTGTHSNGQMGRAPATVHSHVESSCVELKVSMANMSYNKLVSNASLRSAFEQTVKEEIAAHAGPGVTADHVKVSLSPGSVQVHAKITPPDHVHVDHVHSNLNDNLTLGHTLASKVCRIVGMHVVAKGRITANILSATKSVTPSASREAMLQGAGNDFIDRVSSSQVERVADDELFCELQRLCAAQNRLQLKNAELVAELHATRLRLDSKLHHPGLDVEVAKLGQSCVDFRSCLELWKSNMGLITGLFNSSQLQGSVDLWKASMGLATGLFNTFSSLGIAMLHASSACFWAPAGLALAPERPEQQRLAETAKDFADFLATSSPLVDWASKFRGFIGADDPPPPHGFYHSAPNSFAQPNHSRETPFRAPFHAQSLQPALASTTWLLPTAAQRTAHAAGLSAAHMPGHPAYIQCSPQAPILHMAPGSAINLIQTGRLGVARERTPPPGMLSTRSLT